MVSIYLIFANMMLYPALIFRVSILIRKSDYIKSLLVVKVGVFAVYLMQIMSWILAVIIIPIF